MGSGWEAPTASVAAWAGVASVAAVRRGAGVHFPGGTSGDSASPTVARAASVAVLSV